MRAVLCFVILIASLSATGCASFIRSTARSYDIVPGGLTRADDGLRRALIAGSYESAFARSRTPREGAPDDPLLRALYRGLTGYYAGELSEATNAFAIADRLTEQRTTKSVSRAAMSVVTSDRALPYLPTRTERLFLRYYAMNAHARAGNMSGATVEARRLGRLLEDAAESLAPAERPLHATMRDAVGAVFEAAGERNDALVSYRNAALLRGVARRDVDTIALQSPGPDSASLIVFVESGFVAHRVDQGMLVSLHDARPAHRDTLRHDTEARNASGQVEDSALVEGRESIRAVADESDSASTDVQTVTRRALALLESMPAEAMFVNGGAGPTAVRSAGRSPGRTAGRDRDHGYRVNRPMRIGDPTSSFVRVAWSALARSAMPEGGLTLGIQSGGASLLDRAVEVGADISNALAEDFRRAAPGMLARSIARAMAKGAVTESLRKKHGDWAGALASYAGSAVERADTRSWNLLPGSLQVVRVTVPAGMQEASLKVGSGLEALTVRLPQTSLSAGEVRVVSTRVWRDASGFAPGIAAASDTPEKDPRTNR